MTLPVARSGWGQGFWGFQLSINLHCTDIRWFGFLVFGLFVFLQYISEQLLNWFRQFWCCLVAFSATDCCSRLGFRFWSVQLVSTLNPWNGTGPSDSVGSALITLQVNRLSSSSSEGEGESANLKNRLRVVMVGLGLSHSRMRD